MFLMIKKIFILALTQILILTSILTPMSAAAQDVNSLANKIFSNMTTDPSGPMQSQARSIYSLGGGSVRFAQKSVSLFSANAPSFSAGCNGINWHFGGFSFISEKEIQALIESISQAAVGVVIDLAMNVLCPQCYAVMNTMRDYANKMRQGLQDSCALAKRLVAPLSSSLAGTGFGYTEDASRKSCADYKAGEGLADSYAKGIIKTDMCSGVEAVADFIGDQYNSLFGPDPDEKKKKAAEAGVNGNLTFETLKAMGYPPDSYIMSLLMTILGINLYSTDGKSGCKNATQALVSSMQTEIGSAEKAVADQTYARDSMALMTGFGADHPAIIQASDRITKAADYATNAKAELKTAQEANAKATVTTNFCYMPSLLTDTSQLADMLMCGEGPGDAALFKQQMASLFGSTGYYGHDKTGDSQIYRTCSMLAGKEGSKEAMAGGAAGVTTPLKNVSKNFMLYKCDDKKRCLKPGVVSPETFASTKESGANSVPNFKGVYWLVAYLLMKGVADIRCSTNGGSTSTCGTDALDVSTPVGRDKAWVKFVASSDYPLYRIINFAAVYPEQSQAIIAAYASTIAAQHVILSLNQIMKYGNSANFSLANENQAKTTSADEINRLRLEISGQIREAAPYMDKAFKNLSEKKALIEFIIQLNKSLQQEVTSQGLNGNSNLAVTIKNNMAKSDEAAQARTTAAAPTP